MLSPKMAGILSRGDELIILRCGVSMERRWTVEFSDLIGYTDQDHCYVM